MLDPRRARLALCLSALLAACSNGPPAFTDSGGGDGSLADVRETGPRVDAQDVQIGRVCSRDVDCDDQVPCTEDSCGPDMRCRNAPNADLCNDHVYCNGIEVCDVRLGCHRGAPLDCNDDSVCTEDRCVESTMSCEHLPLDRDGDGDPDVHCAQPGCGDGGTAPDGGACWVGHDCDDSDPRVSSTSPEVCNDGIDNNCNGATDAADPGGCITPANDTCADPLRLTASQQLTIPMTGAAADYTTRCGAGVAHDKVVLVHLDAPADLDVDGFTPGGLVELALQTLCGSTSDGDTVECDFAYSAQLRRHSLPAGDYFLIVGSSGSGDVQVDVAIGPATAAPTNESCATAQPIPPTGGIISGDLANATDDVMVTCSGTGRDLVYSLTLSAPQDVAVDYTGPRNSFLAVAIQTDCAMPPATTHCEAGAQGSFVLHQLPAGTYYLVVDASEPLSYTIDVRVNPPTPPPAGDTCANPLTLDTSAPVVFHTGGYQTDYAITCLGIGHDAVLRFDLPRAQDVIADVTEDNSNFVGVSLEDTCGDETTEHTCQTGGALRVFGLGLATGPHYLVVKPYRDDRIHVALHTFDPVAPVDVMNNDTCATAFQVPAGGGYFRGDTTALMGDYASNCNGTLSASSRGNDAVFKLHLDATTRVSLLNDAAFFNVLYITTADTCPGADPMGSGASCTYGVRTSLDTTLPGGDYYIIVDGLNDTDKGAYSLYVHLEPPAP